jgi:C4-dicarboxylate-specific signal transduction histidine kinase
MTLSKMSFMTCLSSSSERYAGESFGNYAETARRRNLDEITHMNRVVAMGELTAALAHELNQPLAAILNNAQVARRFLSDESPDLIQVGVCLADIVADDKRAAEIIQRLRTLVKKGESHADLRDRGHPTPIMA